MRSVGTVRLLNGLWVAARLDEVLMAALRRKRLDPHVERAIFATVASVAIRLPAGRSIADWVDHDVAVPDLTAGDWSEAAAAVLRDETVCAELERQVVTEFDRTGVVFVGAVPASPGHYHGTGPDQHHCRLRRPPPSPWPGDWPELEPGTELAMTSDGIPIRHGIQLATSMAAAHHAGAGPRPVTIACCALDRVLRGDTPADVLIAGEHLRDVPPWRKRITELPGPAGTAGRWFDVRNALHADRERACREEVVRRLRSQLADPTLQHRLCGNTTVSRWVTFPSAGPARLKEASITHDEHIDGRYLLYTNDPDLSADEAETAYLRFTSVAHEFASVHATITPMARPAVWLAQLLIRQAVDLTGQSWPAIVAQLDRVYQITFNDGTHQLSRLAGDQRALFARCRVPVPEAAPGLR